VDCPELGVPVFLDHGVTGATGSTVWVAIRPEKIEIVGKAHDASPPELEDAPEGTNAARAVIRHIAYLGSESVYELELQTGNRVKALRSNLTRWDQEDFTVGQAVWITWHACSPVVLLN